METEDVIFMSSFATAIAKLPDRYLLLEQWLRRRKFAIGYRKKMPQRIIGAIITALKRKRMPDKDGLTDGNESYDRLCQ